MIPFEVGWDSILKNVPTMFPKDLCNDCGLDVSKETGLHVNRIVSDTIQRQYPEGFETFMENGYGIRDRYPLETLKWIYDNPSEVDTGWRCALCEVDAYADMEAPDHPEVEDGLWNAALAVNISSRNPLHYHEFMDRFSNLKEHHPQVFDHIERILTTFPKDKTDFQASAIPFEAGWDSIVKMPFVPGSVREMTAEDSERWGFPEGTEMTQPKNPERFLPRKKLIGDFINEETGKLLPIIIQQGLKANPEAVEREKGMRRVFGDGLRDSPTTTAHIPSDRLGMNPSTEMWFGGKQSDPHAVLNYNTIEQIYTPKNFRRQGMASAILDALVEAKRFGTKYHSGIYPTAMNEQGHMIHDMTPDDKLSYSRPYVDAETGMPYLQTYPHELNPVSGIATKDYIELMASRGLYPDIIQERDINYVPRGLFGMPTGEPLPKAGEPRAANPNNRWVDETAKENNLYFEANQWSRPGSREDDRRGGGWKLDEEQPFIRPTASTIINRAKREAYHRNKVMRELEAASDKCPQTGEPDPITGKVHPHLEDSDFKEPNGCDCWDDWRAARDAYFEEFPEHDWRREFDEDDDEVPNIGFHLSQFDKDFNELVSSGKLIPAPEPTWRLREGKDEYEPLYGGKTLNEWGRERK